MGFTEYFQAREFVQGFQSYFLVALLFSSALLAVLSILNKNKLAGGAIALNVIILLLGFLLLLWLHLKIYASIELINPLNGASMGRIMAPLWIENEKLYFWALFLGFFTYHAYVRNKDRIFAKWLSIFFSGFVILTMLSSNPFSAPLPSLHQEISSYVQSLNSNNIYVAMQSFQNFFGRVIYFYNSTYMWIHPPLLFISYAALIASFLASILMLAKKKDIYDKIAYSYAKLGYILLTVGMLVSYPWALQAWANEPWWWSPKINMSLMMWMFYTAYLHSRLHLHRRGMWNTTAILGIFCFGVLVLTYITTYLVPGVHSYG
ncbi:MAG: cytochrome c biogenesis protein CcsA [Actinomycetota bacterium]|nr:cytochrome c biogenesis protein CcsA [Actinomycetota bacterium]